MLVGVPRESFPGERRVALVPAVLPNLAKAGLEGVIETGAGVEAGYPDADYAAKGAERAHPSWSYPFAHDGTSVFGSFFETYFFPAVSSAYPRTLRHCFEYCGSVA